MSRIDEIKALFPDPPPIPTIRQVAADIAAIAQLHDGAVPDSLAIRRERYELVVQEMRAWSEWARWGFPSGDVLILGTAVVPLPE